MTTLNPSVPGPRLRDAMRRLVRPDLLIIPAVALIGVFFVYPVLSLAVGSFTQPSLGLTHYADVFASEAEVRILGRTLVVAFMVTSVTLVLGYPYAYLMTLAGSRERGLLLFLVLMPFWTSLMARTFAWVVLLQPNGVVSTILDALGLRGVALLGTQPGVTIAMAQVLLPFMVLPLYSNMRGIDRRLVGAAQSMGASPAVSFWKVYLPLSAPGITAGSVLVFILSIGFWVTPRLVGSPQASLIGQVIGTKVEKLLDFASAGALTVILLLITFGLLIAMQGALRKLASEFTASTGVDDE